MPRERGWEQDCLEQKDKLFWLKTKLNATATKFTWKHLFCKLNIASETPQEDFDNFNIVVALTGKPDITITLCGQTRHNNQILWGNYTSHSEFFFFFYKIFFQLSSSSSVEIDLSFHCSRGWLRDCRRVLCRMLKSPLRMFALKGFHKNTPRGFYVWHNGTKVLMPFAQGCGFITAWINLIICDIVDIFFVCFLVIILPCT